MGSLRRLGLIVISALAIVACGDAASRQSMQRYDGNGFTLDVPEDWRIEEKGKDGIGQGVLFLSTDAVRNQRRLPNEVFVFLPEKTFDSVDAHVREEYDFSDIVVSKRRDVDIPGAQEAVRFETEGTTSAPEVTIRQVFIIALRPGGFIVDVVCRGGAQDLNREVCNTILDSLTVMPAR